jgi:hypothetical protein
MIAQLSCVMLCTKDAHRRAPAQCVACLAVVSTRPWPRLPRLALYVRLCAPVRSAEQQAPSQASTLALRHACPSPLWLCLPSSFARPVFFLHQLNSFLHVYLTDGRVPLSGPSPTSVQFASDPRSATSTRASRLPILRSLASPTRAVLLLLNHLCARRTSPRCCPRSTHKRKILACSARFPPPSHLAVFFVFLSASPSPPDRGIFHPGRTGFGSMRRHRTSLAT